MYIPLNKVNVLHHHVLYKRYISLNFRSAGQVGFITCNMRAVKEASIGDTVHLKDAPVPPMVRTWQYISSMLVFDADSIGF